jgi:hypothetical protein
MPVHARHAINSRSLSENDHDIAIGSPRMITAA